MTLLPPTKRRVGWIDPRLRPAWLVVAIAALLGIALSPGTFINADEYLYAGQARLLLAGEITWREGMPLPDGATEGVRYPFGWPLILAPFAAIGFRAMFMAPLLLHLVGTLCLARMLIRRDIPAIAVAVFTFHPVFWSFSRTLMSDLPAAVVLLVAMDAWENRRTARAGLALGYGLFVRMATVFSLPGFLLATFGEWRRSARTLLPLLAAVLVAGLVIWLQNVAAHGDPFSSEYAARGTGHLGTGMLLENVTLYGLGLLLIPPFPLAALLFRPRDSDTWTLVAVPVVLFFCFYTYHEESSSLIETFLGGQRLILSAHVALIVGTARVWSRLPLIRTRWVPLAVGATGPFLHAATLRPLYQRYEPASLAVRACEPRVVAYNRNAARVALASEATRYDVIDDARISGDVDITVLALAEPTNRPIERVPDFRVPAALLARLDDCRQYGEFYLFDLSRRCALTGSVCSIPEENREIRGP